MTLLREYQVVYGARNVSIDTSAVKLTRPGAGVTTQEDANQLFDQRISDLESGGIGELTEIDGGSY